MALTPAEKMRRYRARKRRDEAVVPLRINDVVLEALLNSGTLTESKSRNRTKVAEVLAPVVEDWARLLLEKSCYR